MGAPVSAVLIALEALTLISIWIMLYQLMKQQGRILLRLDALADNEMAEHTGDTGPSTGPAVGTAFPSFSFPDLAGHTIALEDFRGKRVLLVNWSSQCGFCDLIAPDLSKLQPDFLKENVQLLLVSQGTAEADGKLAQEHGLLCPILLMKGARPPEPLQSLGTPAAYLLDEQGKVAKAVAVGAEQVPALARESVGQDSKKRKRLRGERALGESRIERNGLKPGTPAPSFQLPDIHGSTVSLEEYRGHRVLLVFSDPHCGPCDDLAPQLARLHQEHRDNNLAIIMVGRGDAEENRSKAERHGVEFPVVLQEQWKLSKEYGIFATPVAFLIGEDGLIKKTVARGVEEILALAPQAVASETLRKGA
jgi:peroxiredoxin